MRLFIRNGVDSAVHITHTLMCASSRDTRQEPIRSLDRLKLLMESVERAVSHRKGEKNKIEKATLLSPSPRWCVKVTSLVFEPSGHRQAEVVLEAASRCLALAALQNTTEWEPPPNSKHGIEIGARVIAPRSHLQ